MEATPEQRRKLLDTLWEAANRALMDPEDPGFPDPDAVWKEFHDLLAATGWALSVERLEGWG